ncbi:hypothetical protein [Psychromonas hadalis]|uniref:hypothetical protein n=1 Tax=Psychromonas hadalis TaxID=211669 RepID=UPI001FDFB1AE|nr:hypothetical protein [Psychromonas hadalis]
MSIEAAITFLLLYLFLQLPQVRAFLPTFIDLTVLKAQDIALAAVLSSITLISGLMLIAFWASRMANLLKTPKVHKRLNQSAGSIMIAAGSYLALSR